MAGHEEPWRQKARQERQKYRAENPSSNSQDNGKPLPRATVQELVAKQLGSCEHCSHDDLLDADLPEPSWLVEGLVLDEGLTLLGGKKKLGKSWLCLQLAQAVAAGAECLGRSADCGPVVYLCLEDGRRRLKSRLLKQNTPRGLPITYYTRFPPLDGDGMGMLLDLLAERKPRLLILDTLAAAKTGRIDENAAGAMADLGNTLRVLSQVYKAGIFATHHHGKLLSSDPGDDLRGSSALAAAGDVNLGLYREQTGHLIRGEGRDVGEFTLPIAFDPETTWCWQAREPGPSAGARAATSAADRKILEAVGALGAAACEVVAEYVGKSERTIRGKLNQFVEDGLLTATQAESTGGRPRILYSLPGDVSGSSCPFS
jgi:hypothetical protein